MNELKNRQSIRLFQSIKKICGEEKATAILAKLPLSKSPTENKRREWACASCSKLHEHFDDETVKMIKKGCHCKPSPEAIKELKKCYKESSSIEDFVEKANSNGVFYKAEENAILVTYPRCYCPFLNNVKGELPSDWCQCSLGYSEYLFHSATGKDVHAELLESIVLGNNRCVIRVHLDK